MAYSADETIRVMRVMRGHAGHWREGGFGADVVVRLCAQRDEVAPDVLSEPEAKPFEEIGQLGLGLFNTVIALCAGVVW